MKIFTTLSTFAAGSPYQQPKYDDFLERVSDGQKSAGWGHPTDRIAALWSLCPAMTAPANGQIVCDQSTCALVCDDGFIPTGRRRSKCRWNNTRNFFWKKTLADCETCTDLPDPPAGITADCGINAIRKKKCLYKCDNGSEISTSSGDFLQFSAACSCPRPDRICRWKSRKVGEIDAAALSSWTCPNPTVPTTTTQAPPTSPTDPTTPTNPPVPGICDANKPSTCTSLTTAQIGLENEWTCRNCPCINA